MNIQNAYKYAFAKLRRIADDMHHIEYDAVLLVQEAINKPKSFVFAHPEYQLRKQEKNRLLEYVDRRMQFEPIPYILGFSYFFNLQLYVNKNVLIPRPATELLVEYALQTINDSQKKKFNIVDIGTGSGAIIIALVKNLIDNKNKKFHFSASDVSPSILKLAEKNAKTYRVASKINFKVSDLFSNFRPTKFDIMVANLPYLSEQEYCTSPTYRELQFEPKKALVTEHEGLYIFECFFQTAPKFLAKNGTILLEIGYDQADAIADIARKAFPLAQIDVIKDHCGFDRIIKLINT